MCISNANTRHALTSERLVGRELARGRHDAVGLLSGVDVVVFLSRPHHTYSRPAEQRSCCDARSLTPPPPPALRPLRRLLYMYTSRHVLSGADRFQNCVYTTVRTLRVCLSFAVKMMREEEGERGSVQNELIICDCAKTRKPCFLGRVLRASGVCCASDSALFSLAAARAREREGERGERQQRARAPAHAHQRKRTRRGLMHVDLLSVTILCYRRATMCGRSPVEALPRKSTVCANPGFCNLTSRYNEAVFGRSSHFWRQANATGLTEGKDRIGDIARKKGSYNVSIQMNIFAMRQV